MRLPVRSFVPFIAGVAVLCVPAVSLRAQSSPSQSSSSQTTSVQNPAAQTSPNGTYISIDPLAKVRYDNKFDLSLTAAYDHMKAGPTLLQGANLGGLDLTGSMWFTKRWGVQATGRGYIGTSGASPQSAPLNIKGPLVSEWYFAGGPVWLGPHNKHGAILAHALMGGVYGNFEHDLRGLPPSSVGFYANQVAPAAIIGGHFDLNRSARWVFRITPDAMMKWYTIYGTQNRQWDVNFGLSVGVEYKFKRTR